MHDYRGSPLVKKRFKVGDKVRILNINKIRKACFHFKNGDITEVAAVPNGLPFLKSVKKEGSLFYMIWFELEYIERVY